MNKNVPFANLMGKLQSTHIVVGVDFSIVHPIKSSQSFLSFFTRSLEMFKIVGA